MQSFEPIWFNMAFSMILVIAGQFVVSVFHAKALP